MTYTDAKVRRNVIVNGKRSIKDLSQDEFKMIPSATLKQELTEKMDLALKKKDLMRGSRSSKRFGKSV